MVCNVAASHLQRTLEKERSLPHCGKVNAFPGFSHITALVCDDSVAVSPPGGNLTETHYLVTNRHSTVQT